RVLRLGDHGERDRGGGGGDFDDQLHRWRKARDLLGQYHAQYLSALGSEPGHDALWHRGRSGRGGFGQRDRTGQWRGHSGGLGAVSARRAGDRQSGAGRGGRDRGFGGRGGRGGGDYQQHGVGGETIRDRGERV